MVYNLSVIPTLTALFLVSCIQIHEDPFGYVSYLRGDVFVLCSYGANEQRASEQPVRTTYTLFPYFSACPRGNAVMT